MKGKTRLNRDNGRKVKKEGVTIEVGKREEI